MKRDKKEIALERTRKTNDLIKITLCTIGLCAAMLILIFLHDNALPEIIESIEDKGKMEETVWAVERLAYLPPSIVTVVTLYFAYSNKKSYVPVTTQRQKALIVAILMAFLYGILFSGIILGRTLALNIEAFANDFGDFIDMYESLAPWFLVQLIPFSIILAYHLIRSSSEGREMSEK